MTKINVAIAFTPQAQIDYSKVIYHNLKMLKRGHLLIIQRHLKANKAEFHRKTIKNSSVEHINQKNKFNCLIERECIVKKDYNMIKWANKRLLIRF